MTVAELIVVLQAMPQDLPVRGYEDGSSFDLKREDVELYPEENPRALIIG